MPLSTSEIKKRIRQAKDKQEGNAVDPHELASLFTKHELDTLYTPSETSDILAEIAGRPISLDYIKLLRLKGRLPAGKQVTPRAYMYKLLNVLYVTFRQVSDKRQKTS
jgi:hypothetical protein